MGLVLLCAPAAIGQPVSFQPPSFSSIGQGPLAAATGDFRGDGITDLAIANGATQSISVLLGKGDGTFLPAKNYSLPSYCAPNYLAVGDFKKDGKPDLLALCLLGNTIIVLPGVGDGTFGPPIITPLPLQTLGGNLLEGLLVPIAITDFNGDGYADLFLSMGDVEQTSGSTAASSLDLFGAYWPEGVGDGTFRQAATPLGVTDPLSIVSADFNGDGKPDLAILSVDSSASVVSLVIALGQGDGTFRIANSYPVTAGPTLTVADVNGDGVPDIVLSGGNIFSQEGSFGLALYIGKGDGTFTPGQNLSPTIAGSAELAVFGVCLADFAGQGRQDLVAVTVTGQTIDSSAASLVAFPANGDGTYGSPITIAPLSSSIPFAFVAADFNGDGRTDLAFDSMVLAGSDLSFKDVSTPAAAAQLAESLPAGSLGVALNAGNWAEIHSVVVSGGTTNIAQNAWIEIYGAGLTPASASGGLTWIDAPSFASGQMPTQLQGVSAAVDDKAAYVYFISPRQVNVLTPLDSATGPVPVTVNNGAATSAPFTANLQPAAPGFLRFGDGIHIAAEHADYSFLGPVSLSVPGYTFTPAKPGEIILLYGDGFGLPATTLTAGSDVQSSPLPTPWPQVTIGGTPVTVQYAGVIGPGLYQLNVVVPLTAPNGDNQVIATYAGASSPTGAMIPVAQ